MERPDTPKLKVTETAVLRKFEGDKLIEELTIVDGEIVERREYNASG